MSDQHPIHRDRGRSEIAGKPADDARKALSENEAQLDQKATKADERYEALTDDERNELQEQASAERFEEIGDAVKGDEDASGDPSHKDAS